MDEKEQLYRQYHPAFCAALMQSFEKDLSRLECKREYNLNTMPNRIDFVMVKKDGGGELESGLGKRLKKHTLYEYKSPKQDLGLAEYHLGMAYVHLYIHHEDNVSADEITLSFVREGKPVLLMEYLSEQGYVLEESEHGIYFVRKPGYVDIQILVTSELDWKYAWLKALTDKLTSEDVRRIADETDSVTDEQGRRRVRSILDLISLLNRNKDWMKEMMGMGAFLDLFKEEFEEKDRQIKSLSEQLQNQSEQLQNQSEQLQSKDEQLQSKDEQLQSKDEQLQNKDEQLQNKDEQLQNQSEQLQSNERELKEEKEENSRLRKEIEELKKEMKIAML